MIIVTKLVSTGCGQNSVSFNAKSRDVHNLTACCGGFAALYEGAGTATACDKFCRVTTPAAPTQKNQSNEFCDVIKARCRLLDCLRLLLIYHCPGSSHQRSIIFNRDSLFRFRTEQ